MLSKTTKKVTKLYHLFRNPSIAVEKSKSSFQHKTQWKFSSQKGMKKNFLAKPRFEPVTTEFPQYDDLTIQPQS